jgi:virginiamycin B lyase
MKLAVAALLALPLATAALVPPVDVKIDEWTVPWEKSRPSDPFVDGNGQVWFVGQAANYIARLDPLSGKFARFEVDSGTSPHNLVVTADGTVWFAGSGNGIIGELDPATGRVTRHRVGQVGAMDPNTMVLDRRGQLWFTAQESNRVGRLDTKTGEFRIVRVGREGAKPYGIVVDGKQLPWVALSGMNYLIQYNPATLGGYPFALPNAATRVRRLAATSDGKIWYGDYARGMLGRLDPSTRETKEWPLPSGAKSQPYAMAVDDRDRVWVVETGVRPNRLVGFDTKTLTVVANVPIAKSGGGTVHHMTFDAVSRMLWFGTDENTIGRAILVD